MITALREIFGLKQCGGEMAFLAERCSSKKRRVPFYIATPYKN